MLVSESKSSIQNTDTPLSEAEDILIDEYYDELASQQQKYMDEMEEGLSGSFPATETMSTPSDR